jgi:hypothetical protein
MRPVVYVICFLSLIALGAWAYRENYATQAAQREVTALQNEIAELREALSVQRAEWAYLNRPDRLRELATLNFDRLGLFAMEPSQFGSAAEVAYPAPDAGLPPADPHLGANVLDAGEVALSPTGSPSSSLLQGQP